MSAEEKGPGRGSEILPGPLAHLGRITGMEIPGASAEMAFRRWDQIQSRTPQWLIEIPALSA